METFKFSSKKLLIINVKINKRIIFLFSETHLKTSLNGLYHHLTVKNYTAFREVSGVQVVLLVVNFVMLYTVINLFFHWFKSEPTTSLSITNLGHLFYKTKSNLRPSERCLSYTKYCIFKHNNYGTLSYFTTADIVLPNVLYLENIIAK